jgi:hypothetical protein
MKKQTSCGKKEKTRTSRMTIEMTKGMERKKNLIMTIQWC